MRRQTALATTVATVAAAATAALPTTAGAKGVAALAVCGPRACHAVDRAALRNGLEAFDLAPAPRRAEPFFTLRAKARVSSGEIREVVALDWLPRAGLIRTHGMRAWTTPAPVLARALRRAARGLRPEPAGRLAAVRDAPPEANVVEVFSPAGNGPAPASAAPGGGATAIAIGAAVTLAAAGAALTRRRRGRPERRSATLTAGTHRPAP